MIRLGFSEDPQASLSSIRVVDRAQQAKASWRGWWTPAFGLAAAAVLVLAAAAALAHVEVQYGASGFSLRTGWNATAAPHVAAAAAPAAVTPVDAGKLETAFAGIERRIHDLETASHAAAPAPLRQAALTNGRASDDEILRRVRDLLAQSESRQQQELALRIGQVIRDVDAQRTADLARIQQGMGRIDAMTTADAAAHRELANYLLTSSRQK